MAGVVSIAPGQVGVIIRAEAKNVADAVEKAKRITSQRIVSKLKEKSPVDQAHFKNAWQVKADGVTNDAPYAGVIERGARPHGVSPEGQEAILEWAARKFGPDDAHRIAGAVIGKLKQHGQKGLFLVRDNLPEFTIYLQEELEKLLGAK